MLDASWQQYGWSSLWHLPNLLWIYAGDGALFALAISGCIFSLLLFFAISQRFALISLFVCYLSLYQAGQVFTNFQWDYLLMESGFLAIFLINGPNHLIVFMFHWLLFRLRFLSGLSKWFSGDPSWANFTALDYYFETQPLPHIGAWYAHQLPEWVLQAGVGITFFAELIVPLFIFLPRHFRIFAALFTIALQLLIIATSNHNFINLLTIVLCLFLLDDRFLMRLFPRRLQQRRTDNSDLQQSSSAFAVQANASWKLKLFALLILLSSISLSYRMISGKALPRPLQAITSVMHSFGLANVYHLFPTMQTERMELQIEGSQDGKHWQPYVFRYKPGPLDRMPAFIVPHQPRLDWMIWFVPTKSPQASFWFEPFLLGLWHNQKPITDLLEVNPFADKAPRYLRVLAYRYHFTNQQQRQQSGDWWTREYLGDFSQLAPRRP